MIEISGDLLTAFKHKHILAIFHCANQHAVMGGGIAYAIRKKFPSAAEADSNYNKANEGTSPLGTFSKVIIDTAVIYNIYGQVGIGCSDDPLDRNCRYDAFYNGVYRMCQDLIQNHSEITSVGCPYKIASDRAGGDFNIIKAILKSVESRFPKIEFAIYKLTDNVQT